MIGDTLEYTATLEILQALAPGGPFPIRIFPVLAIPAHAMVTDVFVQTVLLAIASDPSAGAVLSAGTNTVLEGGVQPYQNIQGQADVSVFVGAGLTNYPSAPANMGPYSITDPTLMYLRVGLNGSLFAEFPQLTSGSITIRVTLG